MAAKSKNKYDVYIWIKDEIIPSCRNNPRQQIVVDRLISNFYDVYKDTDLSKELRLHLYF